MDYGHITPHNTAGKSEMNRGGEGAEIKQKRRRYCQEDEMERGREWNVMKRLV